MQEKENKRLMVSHIDLDMSGVLVVAKYFGEEFDRIMCTDYHSFEVEDYDYSKFLEYSTIIFADMSPNDVLLNLILDNGIEMEFYDHHESFLPVYEAHVEKLSNLKTKGNVKFTFDNKKSGTRIYFEAMKEKHPDKVITEAMDTFISGVNSYDLFRSKEPNWDLAQNLNRLLWSNLNWGIKDDSPRKYAKFIKMMYDKVISTEPFIFNRYEKNSLLNSVEREKDAYKKGVANLLIRTDEKGHKFGVTRLKSKISIVAFHILRNFKQLDYLLIINEFHKDKLKMSARSREGFNLLSLNKTKGHKNATGLKGTTQRYIGQLWRGQSIYELGYDQEYVDEPDKILEKISKVY